MRPIVTIDEAVEFHSVSFVRYPPDPLCRVVEVIGTNSTGISAGLLDGIGVCFSRVEKYDVIPVQ